MLADIDAERVDAVAGTIGAKAQGTGYQTGIPAAAGVMLLARGAIAQRGTVAPERLDPESFLAEMSRLGCPWQVVDLPAESIAGLRACTQEAVAVEVGS